MSNVSTNPIQLSPPGLLNWLQLKTGGINPDTLQREVMPTIDLQEWWMRAACKRDSGALVDIGGATYGAIVTFGPTVTVPNTAWWYVRNLTVRLQGQGPGAVITRFGLGYAVPTAGGVSPQGDFMLQDALYGSVTEPAIGILSVRGFWLPPGAALGIWVDTVAVNAMRALVTGIDYVELPL